MSNLIPGIIMSFREGLEALLILVLIIKFLEKTSNLHLKKNVFFGFGASIVFSLAVGYILFSTGSKLEKLDEIGKLWESIASLAAVALVTSLIIWMIRNGGEIKKYVENKAALNLTRLGIFTVSFVLIAREGVEIAIFSFAGQYHYLSILSGLTISIIIAAALYFSLFKFEVTTLFKITLIYLIIQAGYLFGYSLHEGVSALKSLGYIGTDSFILTKAYDLSGTILNHKEGFVGLPLNIALGWYSKPEWVQLVTQYVYTFGLLLFWQKLGKNNAKK